MRRATLLGTVLALLAFPVVFVSQAAAAGSPSVTTASASLITSTSATVSGTVDPNGDATTMYAFQYGTTTDYGHETTLTSAGGADTPSTVSASITGLTSGTTYHYRILAMNGSGTATGGDQTFQTTGTAPTPAPTKPTATTGGTPTASVNAATVNAIVNPNGLQTAYYFEFGTTSAYGLQTRPTSAGSGTAPFSVTGSLTGLQSNQTYHYRIVAVSSGGTTLGADATFTTGSPPPIASHLKFFGHTDFVAPNGVGGIFLGCIGGTTCTGKMTISHDGATIATRLHFRIGANAGGIVHYRLTTAGRSLVKSGSSLRITVVVTPSSGIAVTGAVTQHPFQ